MRQLPGQPIEHLMEHISLLRGVGQHHRAADGRVGQLALHVQNLLRPNVGQNHVQLGHILLGDKHRNLPPRDDVREGQHDVIGDDDWDAAEEDGLHEARGPRGPAERAEAEEGALHVLVIGGRVRGGDVKQGVVLEVLPNGCSGTTAGRQTGEGWKGAQVETGSETGEHA